MLFTIKPLEIDFLDRIYQIELRSHKHPWSKKLLEEEFRLDNSFRRCLMVDSLIVAYLFCRVVLDEVEILNIAVDLEFRSRGLASVLLSSAMEEWKKKGAKKAFLEVRKSNQAAINLYTKQGFSVFSERAQYYANDKEDAFCMNLTIS